VDVSNGEIVVNRSGKRMEKDLRRLTAWAISKQIGEEKHQ
jgi:sarcosine oxidase gamma subunit